MPEPVLSTLASTIAVAGLAYHSAKKVIDFIDSIQNAPRLISELKGDVGAILGILEHLQTLGEGHGRDNTSNDTDDLEMCLRSADTQIRDCHAACDELQAKLEKWCPKPKWTAFEMNFRETKIAYYRMRLRDTAARLNLALMFCSLKFNGLRADQMQKFEVEMGDQVDRLSGQLEGLEMGRQECLDAAEGLSVQNHQLAFLQGVVVDRLAKQERCIRDALQLCTAGLTEAEKQIGVKAKNVHAKDKARQMIAMIDNVAGGRPIDFEVDNMTAQDESRQLGVTNDPKLAAQFFGV